MHNNSIFRFSDILKNTINKIWKKNNIDGEVLSFLNQLVDIFRLACINKNKRIGKTIPPEIDTQLNYLIEQFDCPEIQKLYVLNREIYKFLKPVFFKNKPFITPYFVISLQMKTWKSSFQLLKKEITDWNFTLLNQPLIERNHVWCWSNLGHQFGHNLFNDIEGLKEFMQKKLKKTFQEEYLKIFTIAFPKAKLNKTNISLKIKESLVLDKKVQQTFTNILNNLTLNKKLNPDIDDPEATVLIHFLKYHWLHWLENCFADIIGLLIFDAASVVSFVHSYKFFTFEHANLSGGQNINTEQDLIEWFLELNGEYPIYFRFFFMTDALIYIENSLKRKHRFGNRLYERFNPIMDILLEVKMIRGQQRETYRYMDYLLRDPYITIDIDLAKTIVSYMVPRFFTWISEFLDMDEHEWLPKLAWGDKELQEMDNLIYYLLNEKNLPAGTNPIQEVAAARFAYELYPRKLEEINNKIFREKRGNSDYRSHSNELICLDYYFNREKYLDWSMYSKDVAKLGQEYDPLKGILEDMPDQYKEDESYENIITQLKDILHQNSVDINIYKKIKMFLDHYQIYKKIRILLAHMENDLLDKYEKKSHGNQALVAILEEDNFNKVLDALLESNTINSTALEIIHDTLFKFANKKSHLFAGELYRMMKESEKKSYGNSASYFLLYESGELFNKKQYSAAIKNWFDSFGETRIVHREARKGKIKGLILREFYTIYLKKYGKNGKSLTDKYKIVKNDYLSNIKEEVSTDTQLKRKNEIIKNTLKSDSDICDYMKLWIDFYHLFHRDSTINTQLISRIDKKLLEELGNGTYKFDDFKKDFKEALKKICFETLLWIHFKSVRSVYDIRVRKKITSA